MTLGPIQYIAVKFEDGNFHGEITEALTKAHDSGIIRVIDLLFLRKDAQGEIHVIELDDLEDAGGFDRLVNDTISLLSDDDMLELAEELEPNSAEAVLVFEHVWAADFAAAVRRAGGSLVASGFVEHEIVEAAEAYYNQL
ncbi:MAG: hypothetical protein UZ15_CFX003000973 [Chloroflexi bacterium OLB15]|nr:MAG: hypothetical protein UZ15_CFX003000973 [Chloroflexi bacterium OLB15]